MKFMSMRELRLKAASLREQLAADEEIVLTANGKPVGLFTAIDPDDLEVELNAVRRARAKVALDRIRKSAQEEGVGDASPAEVDELIGRTRRARTKTKRGRRA